MSVKLGLSVYSSIPIKEKMNIQNERKYLLYMKLKWILVQIESLIINNLDHSIE